MWAVDIIAKKRRGQQLAAEEINYLVHGYAAGDIPDYQMAAWLMAVCLQGMSADETLALTLAMVDSGSKLDLSAVPGIKVDKHSTGGVADTTTLVVAPLVAAAGVPVAKMSGRGLGFTGGTIDKLAAIPGFRTVLTPAEFIDMLRRHGLAVMGQTPDIAPADGKIYALRDVTATVDSIPLIASSIMSKKLAAGADRILLDVKVGSGAFMRQLDDAIRLAETMVYIGVRCQRETVAIISGMDEPLGQAIGNSLEVQEAVEVLKGRGPAALRQVCLELAARMLVLGGETPDVATGRSKAARILTSGQALAKFREWVTAQAGNEAFIDQPDLLPRARIQTTVTAATTGYVIKMDAAALGRAAMLLGAGRNRKEDNIDLAAGIILLHRRGDLVEAGEALAILFTNEADRIPSAQALCREAIAVGPTPPPPQPLLYGVVDQHGFTSLVQ